MKLFPERHVPRGIIFLIDLLICLFALALAYLVRFDFLSLPYKEELPVLQKALPIYILVRAASFFIGKTHWGIIRHTGTYDAKRIFIAISAGSFLFFILVPIWNRLYNINFLPYSILLVDYLACAFLMIAFRIGVKLIYLETKRDRSEQMNVLLYGAGQAGLITKRTMDRETNRKKNVVAFVDDDSSKTSKSIEGAPIIHTSKLDEYLKSERIHQLVITMQQCNSENRQKVVDLCLKYGVEVLSLPPASSWINGELNVQQIRKVRIEDLLGRKPIRLTSQKLEEQITGKVILVTGAAGSIGSGIARQIIRHNPVKLVLLDQSESPLYEIEQELIRDGYKDSIEVIIADITNVNRMDHVFDAMKPDMVYHAAAYKHVPMMEDNVFEAVTTNVGGTRILVDKSVEYGVSRFVMISTDKAVNPTSVMGATKRVAEMYAQTISDTQTKFITTRFGNVLGSNGSVIPLFRKQIEAGGPVTVTHEAVTRYFMTIPEACQLVLEAGSMGDGGEIFLFDMGESVKIIDLARKMILLSGFKPNEDIHIEITGLRPGEKLYEELLANEENTLKTHHPQILKAKIRSFDMDAVSSAIKQILLFKSHESEKMVAEIKKLVPEYQSNNSDFSKFDLKREQV